MKIKQNISVGHIMPVDYLVCSLWTRKIPRFLLIIFVYGFMILKFRVSKMEGDSISYWALPQSQMTKSMEVGIR